MNDPPTRHAIAWPSPVHCGGLNSEMPVAPGAKSHRRVGLDMQKTVAFARQTIAELAEAAGRPASPAPQQAVVAGRVPFTPIQHWLFEQDLADVHHFNQSALLDLDPSEFPCRVAAPVPALSAGDRPVAPAPDAADGHDRSDPKRYSRVASIAVTAAREAWHDAGLRAGEPGAGVVIGSGGGGIDVGERQ